MATSFARTGLRAYVLGVSLLAAVCTGGVARAGEDYFLPVPNITIYPGDTIKDAWLIDRAFSANTASVRGGVIKSRSALVGKLARRTLLPGVPIPMNGVGAPHAIANGGKVRVVFIQDGLEISTYATALQPGDIGEVISIRNLDSGSTISGIVQADGSVRVGGG